MQKIKISLVLILLFSVIIVKSQTSTQANKNILWVNSFEKAKAVALEKKLTILLFFTGTDTCVNCTKMRQNILDSKEFVEYSTNNFVMLEVNYPNSKKINFRLPK